MVAQNSSSATGDGTRDADTTEVEGSGSSSKEGGKPHVQTHDAAALTDTPASIVASHAPRRSAPAPILTSPPVAFSPSTSRNGPASIDNTSASIPSSASSALASARSPSPSRRQAFAARKLDPLLANLSPMATLEALKASDAVDRHASSQHRLLAESIAHVSPKERALGIRAAVAGKMLREWCAEVDGWEKGGFTIAGKDQEKKRRAAANNNGKGREYEYDVEYWGSLPATTVTEHEDRLDEIQDEMEALELEELKSYVRKAHALSRSRGNSSAVSSPATTPSKVPGSPIADSPGQMEKDLKQIGHRASSSYTKLDDFTVVITATIMQLLPYLSRLSSLIELWQTRLLVLRRVPRFLHLLASAQSALAEANDAISGERELEFARHDFYTTRDVLRAKNNALAETLDSMLDILEGRPDSIPETWIDEMEVLEVKYSDWVADAEDTIMNNILGAATAGQQGAVREIPYREVDAIDETDERDYSYRRMELSNENLMAARNLASSEEGLEEIEEADESEEEHVSSIDGGTESLNGAWTRQSGDELELADDEGTEDDEPRPGPPAHQRLSIPRIDEPHRTESPATVISDGNDYQPGPGDRSSTQTAFRNSAILRVRDSLGQLKHMSATYSTLSVSPELATADSVEYFNATPQDQESHDLSLKPSLLEVRSQMSHQWSGQNSRDASPSSRSVLLDPTSKRSVSVRSQSSSIKSHSASVKRISTMTIQPSDGDDDDGAAEDAQVSDLSDSGSALGQDEGLGIGQMDFAEAAIAEQLSVFQPPQRYDEADDDADVEDVDAADESFEGFHYSPNPQLPRKSSSDETGPRSFHTRSSSGMQPHARSRASTVNTYASWSDHSDSEGDVHGGLKSYRRASQLTVLQEASESRRASRVLQAQVDPLFSYDDVFDSLVQPLSSPEPPVRMREDDIRPFGSPFDVTNSIRERVDFTKRPSADGRARALTSEETSSGASRIPRPNQIQTRRHESEDLRLDTEMLTGIAVPTKPKRSQPQVQPAHHHSDDPLTERISTVLSRIPTPIRLYSGPDVNEAEDAPVPSQPQSPLSDEPPGTPVTDPRTPLNSNPPQSLRAPETQPLRLIPASAPSKISSGSYFPTTRSAPSQSEVKIYHLHRPGAAQPVKLYVRLVGEGAGRVMVRVGGGWSDLEEYLKEYALHHGRSATLSNPDSESVAETIEVHDYDTKVSSSPSIHPNGSSLSVHRTRDLRMDAEGNEDNGRRKSRPISAVFNRSVSHSPAPSPAQTVASVPSPSVVPSPVPVHSKDYVSRARRHVSAGAYLNKAASATASKIASPSPIAGPAAGSPDLRGSSDNSTPSPMGYSAWIRAEHAKDQEMQTPARMEFHGGSRRPSTSSMPMAHARSWSGWRPTTPGSQIAGYGVDGAGMTGLGPAGPASRNNLSSPRKRAWVEGVMRQARRVSSASIGGGRSASGSGPSGMGSSEGTGAGTGTKRVFLRRASLGRTKN